MNILAQITLNISFLQISAALIPRKRTAELKDIHIYTFVGTAKMPSKINFIKKKKTSSVCILINRRMNLASNLHQHCYH